jgi:hypothetical protein
MTVREPVPDLADAVPIGPPMLEVVVPQARPAETAAGAAAGRGAPSPLFVAAVLLYATSGLLLLAFPRSVSAWLDDFTPNPTINALKVGTGALEHTAERIGLSSALDSVRRRFLKQIQRED